MFYKLRCQIIAWLYALMFIEDVVDIEDEIPDWYAKIQFKKFNKWLSKNYGIEYESKNFNKKWLDNLGDKLADTKCFINGIITLKSSSSDHK